MNRVNFQKSVDGGHPVRDKFDQNHAVTSPSYSSYSRRSPQRTKMPALLLRLDSEGEVSTVLNRPPDNVSPAKSRPVLHSQSLDSDIFSKTARRLFSGSTMAKLLCPRNSALPTSIQIESHNLNQKSQPESSAFYGMKTFSSSFDSYQKSSFLHDMSTILMPSKINEYNLFGTHSHQTFRDLENNLLPAVSSSLSASIFSIAKACAACHTSSSGCSVSASTCSTASDKDGSSYAAVSPGVPVTDVCQNCESTTASLSASLGKCASNESSSSVVFHPEDETRESRRKTDSVTTEEKGLREGSVANGKYQQTEDYSGNCDKLKCDSSQNSKSDEASCSSLTPVADLSSVLSLPRKTTKKGRPSSRKQRKRQREKQKTCSLPLVSKISSLNGAEKKQHPFNCSQSKEEDSSCILFEASCSQSPGCGTPKESTPVKSQARHCSISSFFFGGRSDSEADESDGGDLCEGTGDWSASEDETMQTVPKQCAGFSAPLNLDSVFKKQSIPTLKSVFWGEDSDSESEASPAAGSKVCQSSALDTSKEDFSGDSSIDFSSSPLSSPSKSFGFTCGLSIEALFAKKPQVICQAAVKESGFDTVDAVPSSAGDCQLSTGFEVCYESISKINVRWNEDYPSAGFRSCLTISSEEIKDPSIKVHFASGPSFVTVHFVGTEERGGTWHQFALDRERFQRRILDAASVLSPIFEASHRAKVMKRNHQQN